MYKFIFTLSTALLFSVFCLGQAKTEKPGPPPVVTEAKDSSDDDMPDSTDTGESSYFQVGVGLGNALYSNHNHALNSKQASLPFVLNPNVGYYHKSGFNLVAGNYLLNENHSFGVSQYSLAPGYEKQFDNHLDLEVAYTHYFELNKNSVYASPIQNDIYSSLVYKKHWIEPGIEMGYSTGKSNEVVRLDTLIGGVKRKLYDSMANTLHTFSMIFSVQHDFSWHPVFGKSDSISFTPKLMLNMSSNNVNTVNTDNVSSTLGAILTKQELKQVNRALQRRVKKLAKLQSTSFQVESLGLDLTGSYTIGKFTIEPDFYFDYFLQQTDLERLTKVFVVNLNYSF
jgi:hypothetical protein